MDGCFDLVHYGHANALRQAREMGDYLVVGIHSDAEIRKHKGLPVCNEIERYAAIRACKWVDEVVEGAPYVTDLAVMDAHGCEFCVHGDDVSIDADGKDSYAAVKAVGRFRECRRTPSVSTTDLVGRMFLLGGNMREAVSENVTTSLWISQFIGTRKPAKKTDRVVYVCGAFDLFHVGHIAFLEAARKLGDYLIVGIWNDEEVKKRYGPGHPLLSLNERILSVLSCRYVDDVVMGAPPVIGERMLNGLAGSCPPISVVAHGATQPFYYHKQHSIDSIINSSAVSIKSESSGVRRVVEADNFLGKTANNEHERSEADESGAQTKSDSENSPYSEEKIDPYFFPRQRDILVDQIVTPFTYFTTKALVQRIISQRQAYEERNAKKMAKESAYKFSN